jgi:hypothetical protein
VRQVQQNRSWVRPSHPLGAAVARSPQERSGRATGPVDPAQNKLSSENAPSASPMLWDTDPGSEEIYRRAATPRTAFSSSECQRSLSSECQRRLLGVSTARAGVGRIKANVFPGPLTSIVIEPMSSTRAKTVTARKMRSMNGQ